MALPSKPPHRSSTGSSSASSGPRRFKKPLVRRKVCRFCVDKMDYIDFKNVNLLRSFISERGKIISSRATGVCAPHQRGLTRAIKLARNISLLPFSYV